MVQPKKYICKIGKGIIGKEWAKLPLSLRSFSVLEELSGQPALVGRPCCASAEVQNRPPHDAPLRYVNYFELKAVETLRTHKKLLPLP